MGWTLDDYKRQLRQKQWEADNRRRTNQRIKNEVDALQRAYNEIGKIKRDYNDNAARVKKDASLKYVAPSVAWRGSMKNSFDNAMKGRVERGAKNFYDSIDRVHDQIGTALARKKGEYDTGVGILNGLNRSVSWLQGVIRNWVN